MHYIGKEKGGELKKMVKNPKAMRERARQLLKEAAELEKKEKQQKVVQAGEYCKQLFEANFVQFSHDSFVNTIKGIFIDVLPKQE